MIVLLVTAAWLMAAVWSFFATYPGGKREMKRDWVHARERMYIYAFLMVFLWWFSVAWNRHHQSRYNNYPRSIR